jgi:hypothetical protein
MHSTVQTGLYTQNIFGYDYNFYHPPGNANIYNPFPPAPHNYHHKHTTHHQCEEINDDMKTPRQIRKGDFSKTEMSICTNPLCIQNNNNNKNSLNNMISRDSRINTLRRKFKYFWQCTKPCGILTVIFGLLLLSASICGFIFLQVESICEKAQTCLNATIKVCSVSFLVLSIVTIFFGFIIIIYSKRDRHANIIVASTKNLDDLNNLNNTQLKQQQKQLNVSQVNLKVTHKGLSVSSRNLPLMFDSSTMDKVVNANQPLLKSASLTALNTSVLLGNKKLNVNK